MPYHSTICNPSIDRSRRRPRRKFRSAYVGPALSLALIFGCERGTDDRAAAYREALAVQRREEATLANIRRESAVLRGEYHVYVWEASFLSGESTPADWFNPAHVWPRYPRYEPWVGRVRRLTALPAGFDLFFDVWRRRFVDLPWYDRARGQSLLRQSAQRYAVLLQNLDKREQEQQTAVRNAADYARLLAPQ